MVDYQCTREGCKRTAVGRVVLVVPPPPPHDPKSAARGELKGVMLCRECFDQHQSDFVPDEKGWEALVAGFTMAGRVKPDRAACRVELVPFPGLS